MEPLNKSEWSFRLGKMSGSEANIEGNSELLAKYSTKKSFILTSEKPFRLVQRFLMSRSHIKDFLALIFSKISTGLKTNFSIIHIKSMGCVMLAKLIFFIFFHR